MIKFVARNLAASAVALAPVLANSATVISFDPLPTGFDLQRNYTTIASDGFNFSAAPYQFLVASGPTANSNGNYLIWGFGPSALTVERADNAAFDVASVNLGLSWYADNFASASVALDITYAGGGTENRQLTIDHGFSTFNLGLSGVRSLRFEQSLSGPYAALDDLTVMTPVPEPETYASMLAGLAVLAAVARRRKSRAG